ncbi:hypothetical protein FRC04_007667 [Tulasnella sp. 424]|nr:hypothetical protein FRC04_007667 [Tulasnella sp. 424]KAG8979097.1 hypothetical protein FRC05_009307 [Tulasnella sp. 425]
MSDQPNPSSKAVCPEHHAALPEKPFISQGDVHFAAHQVGWIICGFFTIISVGVSAWLINKHLRNYTNKGQQRYIVRCLFLVPIYSIISTLSYILYDSYASPLIIIRDCYEAVVLHAFFCLLLEYISHDEEEQKEAFREIKLKNWMFPLGFIRKKPASSLGTAGISALLTHCFLSQTGLYFLQIMKWGVLQYTVLRPACTLASLILNYIGWYCEASWSPIWGHIYLVTIISLSVTVAMYCLLQLYMPISDLLKPYSPILKFLSVKAVVFLTFWQGTFLAVLASFGVVKDTPYMTAEEINIGFGALLETFEMVIFAFLHVKAFTYIPYRPKPNEQPDFKPTSRLRSLGHVFDFRDMFRQIWKGCVYMWHRMRGYEPDSNERYSHFQRALGQRRLRGSGDKDGQEFDRLALDDPYDRKIPPQRDHPWLKLDSPTSPPSNFHHDGLEEDINSELRRIRAVSEYNQRQKQLREERRERRKRKSGSSSHRRDAAAVEKYEHLPVGGEDIFTRMDEGEDEQTFPKRVDGYRAAPGKPSFWRGWQMKTSSNIEIGLLQLVWCENGMIYNLQFT